MGYTGDAFKFFNEQKAKERSMKEPGRFKYAIKALKENNFTHDVVGEIIRITISKGQVEFWPYTGWFCGRKPIGKVKGRGINNLIKALKDVNGKD